MNTTDTRPSLEDVYRRAHVENGVMLLDEKIPGWRDVIDWNELDLSDGDVCIVGQLESSDLNPEHMLFSLLGIRDWFGLEQYGMFTRLNHGSPETSYEVSTVLQNARYEELTDAWLGWAEDNNLF